MKILIISNRASRHHKALRRQAVDIFLIFFFFLSLCDFSITMPCDFVTDEKKKKCCEKYPESPICLAEDEDQ